MARNDAHRALGCAGTFSRSVRPARSTEACRHRSAWYRIHLRKIDPEDRRYGRLCRCLEAALRRLEIQRQRDDMLLRDRVGKISVDPNLLHVRDDEQRRVFERVGVLPLGRGAGTAAQLLSPSGALAADPDARRRHGRRRPGLPISPGCCVNVTMSVASRISSTSWGSAYSPRIPTFCATQSLPISSTRR